MEGISIDLSYSTYNPVRISIKYINNYRNYDNLLNLIKGIKPRIDHILGISLFIKSYSGIEILLSFSKLEENKKYKII